MIEGVLKWFREMGGVMSSCISQIQAHCTRSYCIIYNDNYLANSNPPQTNKKYHSHICIQLYGFVHHFRVIGQRWCSVRHVSKGTTLVPRQTPATGAWRTNVIPQAWSMYMLPNLFLKLRILSAINLTIIINLEKTLNGPPFNGA